MCTNVDFFQGACTLQDFFQGSTLPPACTRVQRQVLGFLLLSSEISVFRYTDHPYIASCHSIWRCSSWVAVSPLSLRCLPTDQDTYLHVNSALCFPNLVKFPSQAQ